MGNCILILTITVLTGDFTAGEFANIFAAEGLSALEGILV